jgi:hypothetical protein
MNGHDKLAQALRAAPIGAQERSELEQRIADGVPPADVLSNLESEQLLLILAGADAATSDGVADSLFEGIRSRLERAPTRGTAPEHASETLSSEDLLMRLAGVDGSVSAATADSIFDAIQARLGGDEAATAPRNAGRMDPARPVAPTSVSVGASPRRRLLSSRWHVGAAVAGAAAVLLFGLVWLGSDLLPPDSTTKGKMAAGAPAIRLRIFAGAQSARGPRLVRELGDGSDLDRDEVVLFRVHLDGPGFVTLAVVEDARARVIWRSQKAMGVGEGELAHLGRAMAYQPDADTAGPLRFVAIAAETADEMGGLDNLKAPDVASISNSCSACTFDVKEIIMNN